MAVTDTSGAPLKFVAEADFSKVEKDAEKAFGRINKKAGESIKDIFKNLDVEMRPASEGLAKVTRETAKTLVATKDLKSAFDHLSGSAGGVHVNIAKARAETLGLAQTERDLRKALKEKLITEDEYIQKLAIISQKRTENTDKLKQYREELKKVEVQQSKTKPYTSADTAFEITNMHGSDSGVIAGGTVVNTKEIERAAQANKAFAASSHEAATALGKQAGASSKATVEIQGQTESIQGLKEELLGYQRMAASATDPAKLKLYNKEIQDIQAEIKRMSNVGKVGFDSMGNAIKGAEKQTTGLVRGLSSGIEMLRRMAYMIPGLGITGLVALAIKPISAFIKSLGQVKKTISETFADSTYKSAISNVENLKNNIEQANKGIISKNKVVAEYNKTIGKTAGELKKFGDVEKWIQDRSGAYIEVIRLRAEAQALLNISIDETMKAQQRLHKGIDFDFFSVDDWTNRVKSMFLGGGMAEQMARDVAASAKQSEKFKNLWKDLTDKIRQINKENGFNFDEVPSGLSEKGIRAYQSLLQKVADLTAEYSRKNMSNEEAEIQAVRDKFTKIADEVSRFNKDPKNKVKISMEGVDELRDVIISDLEYKHQTAALKFEIENQKTLYQDFEQFKTQTSEAHAKERYGMLMSEYESIEGLLESHQQELYDLAQSRDLTREEVERLKYLNEELDKIRKQGRDKEAADFASAFHDAETYNDKLLKAEEKYQLQLIASGGKFSEEQLANLKQKRDDEINAIKEAELQKQDVYKRSGEEILILTRNQIKEQIKTMRSLLDSGALKGELKEQIENELKGLEVILKIGVDESNISNLEKQRDGIIKAIEARKKLKITTPENEKELQGLIDKLVEIEGKINDINGSGLKKFFASLKDNKDLIAVSEGLGLASDAAFMLSDALGGVDTEAGYTLDTIGQLADSAADLGLAIASGNPVAMIQSGIKAVGTLFSIGKKVKEMNAAARKEVEEYYENAIKGEKAYQDALNARELQVIRNKKAVLQGIRDEMALRKEQSAADSKEADQIMKKLSGMSFVSGQTSKHGTWFRKAKVTKHYESLRGKSFEDLSLLLEQGKLEGGAKELVERLVELEKQGFDTAQAMAELAKEVEAIFTGTTSDSLSNSLLNMFKEGKTGAQDLANFFEQTMSDAALSIFKNKVLDEAMADFYKQFAKSAESGDKLTDTEIKDLKRLFDDMTSNVASQFEQMKEITGLDLTTDSQKSGIHNSIERMTEQTGSELTGLFRAQFDVSKNLLELQKQQWQLANGYNRTGVENLIAIQANTLRTANNTEHNKRLENIEVSLDIIARNSSAGQSDRDLYI